MKRFKFIDLFSGIGGFHQAMGNLGGSCVLASEIDEFAINTYSENYHIDSARDITTIDDLSIPYHDVLCAGFPCQAFSKAGKQMGFADETKGTLFFQVARILKSSRPKFFILENVRNLVAHDNGNTMRVIENALNELGYNFKTIIMSPHQLGVPQLRERVYILGIRKDVFSGELIFTLPQRSKDSVDIYSAGIIDENPPEKYNISEHEIAVLNCWDEFHKGIKEKTIGFPIWSFEFGSTESLEGLPKWKADFCRKNRQLYLDNKSFIDEWFEKWNNLKDFTPTERKLEWQAGDSIDTIWDAFIQFRPSGIRVKRPDAFPALVAMVQIPIIGRYKRRLTPREAARLQSFPDSFIPNENDHQAYKQFGNAVNVNCVQFLAEQLFEYGNGGGKRMEQVLKSEQILPNTSLAIDYDQPLLSSRAICTAFSNALGGDCRIEKYDGTKTVYSYTDNGTKHYFLAGAVTYLSKPHPIFKKRLQLKKWYKEFYAEHKNDANTKIHLIGVYHYEGLIVFVEFAIEDYIERKLNSSAAHVYSNDIYQAVINGHFTKTDRNGNHVTSVISRCFKQYLTGAVQENRLFSLFKKFNSEFCFNQWVDAKTAISEMRDGHWYQWKGTEWPGWFLEYKVAGFVEKEHCQAFMIYIGNLKDDSMHDFDLLFPTEKYYGDLKASDIDHSEAPGNDQESVLNAINQCGRLWYIIYEHNTIKDSDREYEMAKERMALIGNPYEEGGKISYASRMKHSVNFKRMRIFELNRINMNEALSVFNQGHQPDGSARRPKFLINKKNIDNCIVFTYDA